MVSRANDKRLNKVARKGFLGSCVGFITFTGDFIIE